MCRKAFGIEKEGFEEAFEAFFIGSCCHECTPSYFPLYDKLGDDHVALGRYFGAYVVEFFGCHQRGREMAQVLPDS